MEVVVATLNEYSWLVLKELLLGMHVSNPIPNAGALIPAISDEAAQGCDRTPIRLIRQESTGGARAWALVM